MSADARLPPELRRADGLCQTERGTCTLRAALEEFNLSLEGCTEFDTFHQVILPAGVYPLGKDEPPLLVGREAAMSVFSFKEHLTTRVGKAR